MFCFLCGTHEKGELSLVSCSDKAEVLFLCYGLASQNTPALKGFAALQIKVQDKPGCTIPGCPYLLHSLLSLEVDPAPLPRGAQIHSASKRTDTNC